MIDLDSALVVDDSKLLREVLRTVLGPHCRRVEAAGSCEEARQALAGASFDLQLLDVVLPDGSGFDLVEEQTLSGGAGCIVLMTATATPEGEQEAHLAGARGYLPKPVSITDIDRVLGGVESRRQDRRRATRAAVRLLDTRSGATPVISWHLRDLGLGGAFVETQGPLPLGARLELEILNGVQPIRLQAHVVRVQLPSWLYPGGAGVRFDRVSDEARQELQALVEELELQERAGR